LYADVKIMLDLQQVEPGDWTLGDVDFEFFGLEHSLARAWFPRRDEFVDDALGFAENLKICFAVR
jgi:hypothetical protein